VVKNYGLIVWHFIGIILRISN